MLVPFLSLAHRTYGASVPPGVQIARDENYLRAAVKITACKKNFPDYPIRTAAGSEWHHVSMISPEGASCVWKELRQQSD
jgi:hypothetical protein